MGERACQRGDRWTILNFGSGSQRAFVRYGVALLLALAAQLCRVFLHHPDSVPFTTYYPFIVLAAWYGGLGPGVLCTVLCALETDYFSLHPFGSFTITNPDYMLGIVLFMLTGMSASVLFEQLRRARNAERKLRQKEERLHAHLQAIVDFSDDAMVMRTSDGTITSWNRAAELMFGYTAQEAIGRSFFMLVPPEELLKEQAILNRIQNGGMQRNRQAIRMHKDGTRLATLVSAAHIRDAQGCELGIVGIARDISELKSVEAEYARQAKELAAQKKMMESVITYSPVAKALVRGKDFVYYLANPAYEQMQPGVQVVGHSVQELWAESSAEIMELFRQVLETNQPAHLKMVRRLVPQADGKESKAIWVDISYVPVKGIREPDETDLLIVLNDMTAVKHSEDELRENDERTRLLIEHAPAALAMFDTGMCYLQCSQRWKTDYGLEGQNLSGRSHYEVFPEASDEWKAVHKQGLQGEVVRSEGEIFRRADGHEQWIRWEVRPWRKGDGEVGGIVIFSEDITIRKHFEDEMLRLNEVLEDRVKTRTAQLENSNRELESFAYSVSHDLRAPLRGIDGWTQALWEDYGEKLDAQARKYLDRVRSEAQRMGHLIDDLLHLSRVTRQPVKLGRVDLTSLVNMVAERIHEERLEQRIRFVIEPGMLVMGDERLLEIVLTNLLGNAAKFSSKKEESVIEFGLDPKDHMRRTFFVRDNGAGFDMNYAGQLFAPFQRLHSAAEFPGTGIGLATVQRIVLKHGGTIRAEAEPGVGATFIFTLGGAECENI
ncbi:PAS domain S-box protein [Telmatobacter bradus]|uniref:PAS domain S-box protein n=1 Tax=Telmatobacter bradus TaxID=474953 RepID=UPI003B42F984